MFIKITKNTVASGMKLIKGKVINVPDDVSLTDARLLLALGKAEECEAPKPKRKPKGTK